MKWKQREPVSQPRGRDSILEKIAKIRGIDLQTFLFPKIKHLFNPRLLKNIEEVADIIFDAIKTKKRICISCDPDADGIMSTVIMYKYLIQFTDNIYYVYNQRSFGHGVENQLKFIEDGTDLIIILDSSSNSVRACKALKNKGIEVVILDHHSIDVENPYAVLVNPQNDDYPNKHLSGSGVTFKTIQVLDERINSGTAWEFIDLCAIGMIGDMMRCDVLENRYLMTEGMKNIKNFGIKAILENKKIDKENVDSQTVSFTIVPLLNGSARLDQIELSIELMLSDDYSHCQYLAEELNKLNKKRKVIQKKLAVEYSKNIDFNDKVLIALGDMASKSFNGLVATNISQENKKPSLVGRDHKGSIAGSYRTYGDFDMQVFLRECSIIEEANGHPFAGGFKLFSRNLPLFKQYVNEKLEGFEFDTTLEYDLELDISEVNEQLILDVEKINYLTGQGFPTIKFRINGLYYDRDARKVIGENLDTIKIKLDDITLMKFSTDQSYANDIPDMSEIEVVGQLNLNVWISGYGREFRTNQIFIDDFLVVN